MDGKREDKQLSPGVTQECGNTPFSTTQLWQLRFQALFQAFPYAVSYTYDYEAGITVPNLRGRKLRIKAVKVAQMN